MTALRIPRHRGQADAVDPAVESRCSSKYVSVIIKVAILMLRLFCKENRSETNRAQNLKDKEGAISHRARRFLDLVEPLHGVEDDFFCQSVDCRRGPKGFGTTFERFVVVWIKDKGRRSVTDDLLQRLK